MIFIDRRFSNSAIYFWVFSRKSLRLLRHVDGPTPIPPGICILATIATGVCKLSALRVPTHVAGSLIVTAPCLGWIGAFPRVQRGKRLRPAV